MLLLHCSSQVLVMMSLATLQEYDQRTVTVPKDIFSKLSGAAQTSGWLCSIAWASCRLRL